MKFCPFFLTLRAASLVCALSTHAPVQRVLDRPQTNLAGATSELNFTSSSPHIFSSLCSLLQQWPNTIFPNGHSIVPCEVLAYTKLYHGRMDNQIPPDPEWFAFDIEMSYGIMGQGRNSHMLTYQSVKPVSCIYFDGMSASLAGAGQLDSQMVFLYGNTTGIPPPESARPGNPILDEYRRARGLCKWVQDNSLGGPGWGVEGIVRMNAGFEMIWCNFSSPSITLLSHLNVTAPLLVKPALDDDDNRRTMILTERVPELVEGSLASTASSFPMPSSTTSKAPTRPSGARPVYWEDFRLEPFGMSGFREWFRSATWHYGSSGMGPGRPEMRVKLLACGFMSYYDPVFTRLASNRDITQQHSLNLSATGVWQGPGSHGNRTAALEELVRRRRTHTLAAIDASEAPVMNSAIAKILRAFGPTSRSHDVECTGVDWAATSHEISDRYSRPLLQLSHALASPPLSSEKSTAARNSLAQLRQKSHPLLMPFLEYPESSVNDSNFDDSQWSLESKTARDTLSRCRYSYTSLLYDAEGNLRTKIGRPERVLIAATEDVLAAICTRIISVGFGIEYEWLSRWNTPNATAINPVLRNLTDLALSWHRELEELGAWLGWAGDEIGCEELCRSDEYCYIPMWPVIFRGGTDRRRPPYYHPPEGDKGPEPAKGEYSPYHYGSPPKLDDLEQGLWSPRCIKV